MTTTFKFNWGTGIFLFYSAFVLGILSLVVMANRQQIDLVTDDYYAKGVAYQTIIQEQKNTSALAEKPKVSESQNGIAQITFTHRVEGTVEFFRPSDKELDFTLPLDLKKQEDNTVVQLIDKNLKSGLWRVKLAWHENGKNYFQESVLVISE